jgi:hypothetical protein
MIEHARRLTCSASRLQLVATAAPPAPDAVRGSSTRSAISSRSGAPISCRWCSPARPPAGPPDASRRRSEAFARTSIPPPGARVEQRLVVPLDPRACGLPLTACVTALRRRRDFGKATTNRRLVGVFGPVSRGLQFRTSSHHPLTVERLVASDPSATDFISKRRNMDLRSRSEFCILSVGTENSRRL